MADLSIASTITPVFADYEGYDMIAAVTITNGQAVRQNTSGKAALADANAGSGAEKFRGLALTKVGASQGVSVLKRGHVYGFDLSSLAYDALVYLSDTAGALADAPSTTSSVPVGRVVALSDSNLTKVLYIDAAWVMPSLANLVFVSTEQTGTGSAQNVAHGLSVIPRAVLVVPTDLTAATVGQYSAVEGTHTNINVVVTVTSGKKYKVLAYA